MENNVHRAPLKPAIRIGKGTKIWHYCNIMPPVEIGENCMIGSYVQLDPGTQVGDFTKIEPYSAITGRIGKNCFIGPYTLFIDAKYPPGSSARRPVLGNNVIIGAQSMIMPVKIRDYAVVSAGSIVTRDVGRATWVQGQPAREIGTRGRYEQKRTNWNQ